jgi:lipoate-protein ligase A
MNEAIEEAILIARHEGQLLDTIHLWQNRETVVLARNADIATTVNDHELESNGVSIVRRAGAGRNMYHDRGTLNLTYAIDQKGLFPDDPPLSDVFKGLCQPVTEAILALGLDNRTDDYGQRIVAKGGTISQTSVTFYYDFILFQVSLNVCTNLALSRQLLKYADAPTSLINELNRHVRPEEIEGSLLTALSHRFRIELRAKSLPNREPNC